MKQAMPSGSGRGDDVLALVRLLQLASPALPIGAFSYSQGLERVVEDGTVHDAASARTWIGDVLDWAFAPGEAAIVWRLLASAMQRDTTAFVRWNERFRAMRETSELRAETEQMGGSLGRLAADLNLLDAFARDLLASLQPATLPAAWALAARGLSVEAAAAHVGYLWAWLESQVLAAVKAVPLGQVAGQRLLLALGARIPGAAQRARGIADEDIASFAPGLALASARHETQYTRLFRS